MQLAFNKIQCCVHEHGGYLGGSRGGHFQILECGDSVMGQCAADASVLETFIVVQLTSLMIINYTMIKRNMKLLALSFTCEREGSRQRQVPGRRGI